MENNTIGRLTTTERTKKQCLGGGFDFHPEGRPALPAMCKVCSSCYLPNRFGRRCFKSPQNHEKLEQLKESQPSSSSGPVRKTTFELKNPLQKKTVNTPNIFQHFNEQNGKFYHCAGLKKSANRFHSRHRINFNFCLLFQLLENRRSRRTTTPGSRSSD